MYADDDEPCLAHERVERAALYVVLKANATLITYPPVALGLGHTSLEDKVAALLWAIFLEISYPCLQDYCNSFVSITTDMGTEIGAADYQLRTIDEMLPPYVAATQLLEDGDGDGYLSDASASCQHVFSNALTVAGMLHIFSNASKDVYRAVSYWPDLYAALKTPEPLVASKDRLKKFTFMCVDASVHDSAIFVIVPHLYDKRWGEVFKFCSWAQRRLPVMIDTWDEEKF